MFTTPADQMKAELLRLDLLIHREILRLRASYQLSLDEFRGLYISDAQVDSLIADVAMNEGDLVTAETLTAQATALRRAIDEEDDASLPWSRLGQTCGLSPRERDILLMALAPDLDRKYERLYAYLNDDVTRKWPTRDLALRLFADEPGAELPLRACLAPTARLHALGLVMSDDAGSDTSSWLAGRLHAAPVLAHHVLGLTLLDPSLAHFITVESPAIDWAEVPVESWLRDRLTRVPDLFRAQRDPGLNGSVAVEAPTSEADIARGDSRDEGPSPPALVFVGRAGSGRRAAAKTLAGALGLGLIRLDLAAVLAVGNDRHQLCLRPLGLQQRLGRSVVLVESAEALLDRNQVGPHEAVSLVAQLIDTGGPLIFTFPPGTRWSQLLTPYRHLAFEFAELPCAARQRLWEEEIGAAHLAVDANTPAALASRFALTSGQLVGAVRAAADRALLAGKERAEPTDALLLEAARDQSDHALAELASRVRLIHTWDDVVLPPITLRALKEITAAIAHRHVVYGEWGFARRIAGGQGLKVMFAGPSGTGKTMTASVMARELGLDLYAIDLSRIVSKYIGETEKNLDQVFRAAEHSNAILFFDEADALLGKRSEVKEAHDRYANIEISYLLQKMEEHSGAVILASNLQRNIDEAFARRLHYVVDFPFPDELLRERLWQGMFPAEAPLAPDVDLAFWARRFDLAGGDIRNVALDAAFLAAQNGRVITMQHLADAMMRQETKRGRVPSRGEFVGGGQHAR